MANVREATESTQRSSWLRYWIPLSIAAMAGVFELVNWTTNLTAEKLVPQYATSAQTVLGRMVFQLAVGAILVWLLVTRQVSWKLKKAVFGTVALGVGLLFACIREVENTGNNNYVIRFRWEKTQDERLAEFQKESQKSTSLDAQLDPLGPIFTDFLGPKRDGIAAGPTLITDYNTSPPQELWRRPVGGGYASCVLSGGLAVTIEQRADQEVIVALDLATGADRWTRGYDGHFQEKLGGDGPRATPTIADNQVFALGAAGLLVSLDLASGAERWKTNILADANANNITWGMSGSPLVTADKVIVNPGGQNDSGLVAYDRQSGQRVWSAGKNKASYASPVLANIDAVEQVLIFDADGLAGHELDSGHELWRFAFKNPNGISTCQPLVLPNNQLFVSAGYDAGAVLVQVSHTDSNWTTQEIWTSKQMKCKMGSCVFLNGYIYGLDDGILACIEATSGKRQWKGGRYGHGQFLLRNDVLVIQAESGELALVAADPAKHRELAKISMLSGSKAWNAPALAGNLLLLRNHFEAVLLKLPTQP